MPHTLPHWPYATAVDQALVDRGVPRGTVRVERLPGERMCIWLRWDVSHKTLARALKTFPRPLP
ncbi:hypothetical protein OG585_50270 (plasmid) [Streptomyces sp. NBC_01340]|uniref:hypothetical protein n=1 Tax=unclassified Streptomyces TaxID=2593676 RepID=UPI0022541317|nr:MULTISPECIES: hypothetical protein [unclassified Streptomyces]MCX4460677.1 hypothetical protein [Streptomyces sp. NBC_01719]MCX4499993.1 hypothetical protein [Streptomyces sp. NBC_01728]WSI45100.1 hypothetical protein OG585_50270 [Streptomyces sp. NBC_01340]